MKGQPGQKQQMHVERTISKSEKRLAQFREKNAQNPLPALEGPLPPDTGNPRNAGIPQECEQNIKELFLMDGITYTQAAALAGVSVPTARAYFQRWAEEMVEEPSYENWSARQLRVRARALEGITKQLLAVSEHLTTIQRIYNGIIYEEDGETLRKPDEINHITQRAYASQIRETMEMMGGLRTESLVIQSAPPPDVILDREIEQAIAGRIEHKPENPPKSV